MMGEVDTHDPKTCPTTRSGYREKRVDQHAPNGDTRRERNESWRKHGREYEPIEGDERDGEAHAGTRGR